eukprot:SAG11_NODE_1419_length_4957_cov_3.968711_4_plen_150_part_00
MVFGRTLGVHDVACLQERMLTSLPEVAPSYYGCTVRCQKKTPAPGVDKIKSMALCKRICAVCCMLTVVQRRDALNFVADAVMEDESCLFVRPPGGECPYLGQGSEPPGAELVSYHWQGVVSVDDLMVCNPTRCWWAFRSVLICARHANQ